jgi:hypothetical protein
MQEHPKALSTYFIKNIKYKTMGNLQKTKS